MTEILAAGGVVWRPGADPGRVEIAVIHRPKYNDWSLPKGKLDPGETPLDAAVREVYEETGHHVRVGASLGTIRYRKATADGGSALKTVHYWVMTSTGGRFTAGREVDRLEWMPPAEAARRVSYRMDREVIERFVNDGLPTEK